MKIQECRICGCKSRLLLGVCCQCDEYMDFIEKEMENSSVKIPDKYMDTVAWFLYQFYEKTF